MFFITKVSYKKFLFSITLCFKYRINEKMKGMKGGERQILKEITKGRKILKSNQKRYTLKYFPR